MKSLDIHPRLMRFFYMILALNLIISIATQYNKEYESTAYWVMNLLFPLWASIIGSLPFGLIIFIIPQGKMDLPKRLLRSHVFGMMICSFIFFVFYLYNLMLQQPAP